MFERSFPSEWLYGMVPRLSRKWESLLSAIGTDSIRNVLGGPFAAAVLENMDGIGGMHAWQWCKSLPLHVIHLH
jgi:hypothetical protein